MKVVKDISGTGSAGGECGEVSGNLPLPRVDGGDARFTVGLAVDVAAVLAGHGYPALSRGADLVRVQLALFRLIYGEG
jgi:hypothetical protein